MLKIVLRLTSFATVMGLSGPAWAGRTLLGHYFDAARTSCVERLVTRRPRIRLDRVVLRRYQAPDRAATLALLNDAEINRRYLIGDFSDPAAVIQYVDHTLTRAFVEQQVYRRGLVRKFRFVIEESGTRRLVGLGVLSLATEHRNTWEIGYAIGPADRRRGLATEVARGLVQWIRRHDPNPRIEASPYLTNAASQAVLARAGFEEVDHFDDRGVWHWRGNHY